MDSAILLAAGLATRLRPLSLELPKPLFPVGDRPLIEHTARLLRARGFHHFAVNAHHRADDVRRWIERCPFAVSLSEERDLLGTAGGVARACAVAGFEDRSVLVWNGDILATFDVAALSIAHRESGAEATLVVAARSGTSGNVGFAGDGRVVRLRAESTRGGEVASGWSLGIWALSPRFIQLLPKTGCMVADGFLPALRRGIDARVHLVDAPFIDIGTLDAYREANRSWLAARGLENYVAADSRARIAAGVTLHATVVGSGARVEGEGAFRRCVVWDGAVAAAPLEDAVVTSNGIFR